MISDLSTLYKMTIGQSWKKIRTDKLIKFFGSIRWLSLADSPKITINSDNKRGKCFSPPSLGFASYFWQETGELKDSFFITIFFFFNVAGDLFSDSNYTIIIWLHKMILRLHFPLHFYHPSLLNSSHVSDHQTIENIVLKKHWVFQGDLVFWQLLFQG